MARSFLPPIIGHLTLPNLPNLKCPVSGVHSTWLKEASGKGKGATPLTFAEVRVSPSNSVKPNIGATELAEALNRVSPFAAKDDNRPTLACVLFTAKEGKLTLV